MEYWLFFRDMYWAELPRELISDKVLEIFSLFNLFGSTLDDVFVHLYSKKVLGKLDTSNLKRLKNLFEKLLSIKTIVSKMSKYFFY
ncbi:CRASP family complement regulator-acquiring lipoprotein [Borreliella turdi]|uniref:CRASP family complement regulator-acquiring lipoprotein n=1 Tax=Borreliella turdi TaxID=57863 RepID=UPI002286B8C6|nr:CRASP family complement regulator-acquiring lipoprotein [Borreliella turdi]